MRALACALLVGSLSVVTNGWAQAEPPPAPAPPSAPASKPSRAAVSRVVEALASDLTKVPKGAFVVAAPFVSEPVAPKGAQLAALLASQLSGRLGGGARSFGEPLALAEAREKAHGSPALVYVSATVSSGKLRVAVDVFPVPKTIWSRIRDPEPGPRLHAFAEASVDAEVRSYLAPIPLVAANVARAQNFETDVLALACGDLDGDGALEILSVSRKRVTTLRLREGKVVPLRSRAWPDLSPLSSSPFREPIGLAGLATQTGPDGSVLRFADVGQTDRDKSVRLDAELLVVGSAAGLPLVVGDASACVRRAPPLLSAPISPCFAGDPPPSLALPGTFDALASASLVSPNGQAYWVLASRDARGVVTLRDEAGHQAVVEGVGAQLALGDLDQDGEPELVSALDALGAEVDAVVVRSWSREKPSRMKEAYRLPAAAGVTALGICPPDDAFRAPLVVATTDEIWVVR